MKGGKRAGAGRPKGSRNKVTKESIALAEKKGRTPLEFLLDLMNDSRRDLELRLDAAGKAAPYVHPKLAQTELNVNGNLNTKTDDDLRAELTELLKDPEVAAALARAGGKA